MYNNDQIKSGQVSVNFRAYIVVLLDKIIIKREHE